MGIREQRGIKITATAPGNDICSREGKKSKIFGQPLLALVAVGVDTNGTILSHINWIDVADEPEVRIQMLNSIKEGLERMAEEIGNYNR